MVIPNYLCDRHDTLTMWGMARLFQEVAGAHVAAGGIGFNDLMNQGKAWVLSRMFYHVERLPREDEEVTATTWSRGCDGLFAFREFQLIDGKGGVCASASSYWAVIDLKTRHVVRLHDLMEGFRHDPRYATSQLVIDRLRFSDRVGESAPEITFQVRNSMIDHTGHVNNAEYVKWIFDSLPEGFEVSAPFDFHIEYILETLPRESVVINCLQDGEGVAFQVANNRSVAVRARLNFLDQQL